MLSSQLFDPSKFTLGSIGSRQVLKDLRDMILGKSEAGLEREIFFLTEHGNFALPAK